MYHALPLRAAALLLLCAHTAGKRFKPPRRELTVTEGPPALLKALEYPCEDDPSQTCSGIPHIEALFGECARGRIFVSGTSHLSTRFVTPRD